MSCGPIWDRVATPYFRRPDPAKLPFMTDDPPPNMFDLQGRPKGRGRFFIGFAAAAALVISGAIGGAVGASLTQSRAGASVALPGSANGTPVSFADVAQRVKPAVVSVHVEIRPAYSNGADASGPDNPFNDFFRRFGGQRVQPRQEAAGSGFFISQDGFIVTNNHVVENAERLQVTLDDGRTLDARLVGRDPRTDLALLKVEGGPFPFTQFAQHEPRIGDWVLAVGNPFGLGGSVTSGIVSARGRDIGAGPYDDFLQIDAPVNQGNSGGPAFNLNGEVVGVNTAIYSPSGGNVGIAFAIPAATAQPVVEALMRRGSVTRGYLGVSAQPLTDDIARGMGLANAHGALIAEVTSGSPAERAGLRPGDVILSVNDRAVDDARALARIVGGFSPGANATVAYVRGGEQRTARVALATQPDSESADARSAPNGKDNGVGSGAQGGNAALGLATAPVGQGRGGVVITGVDPDGPAAERGVNVGDVILEAGGHPVAQPGDLDAAVTEARQTGRGVLLLRVQSEQGVGYVAVPLGQG